jgi:hypothetical protein
MTVDHALSGRLSGSSVELTPLAGNGVPGGLELGPGGVTFSEKVPSTELRKRPKRMR